MKRQEIIDVLTDRLRSLPTFNLVRTWENLPNQYSTNAIYLKDTREKYEKKNNVYQATLRIEIVAIVIETPSQTAANLGNLALTELISAVTDLTGKDVIFNLAESFKYIDTKGVTACEIELDIDVKYRF